MIDVLKAMLERTRFVRGLRSWSGFRQVGVAYERSLRHDGFAVRELRYFFIWPLGLMYLRKLLHGTKERPGKPYTVSVPPGPVNRLFASLSRTEQRLMRLGVHWPLGSSLLAVVEKPRALSWDEALSASANTAG